MQKPTKEEFFKALMEDLESQWDGYVEAIEIGAAAGGGWASLEDINDAINDFIFYVVR